MSFRKKASYLIEQIDGLSEEDIDEVFEEWGEMEFDDDLMGYDRALAALWDLGYRKMLENCGRLEAYEQQFVRTPEEK
jgi:6-phosphogluconate dehydrogenase